MKRLPGIIDGGGGYGLVIEKDPFSRTAPLRLAATLHCYPRGSLGMADIRSFFGPPSGAGGAAKPKAPAPASKKSSQGKPARASVAAGKKASPAAAKKAGSSNKGVGKMT